MKPALPIIKGDRSAPRLPIALHLRVVDDRPGPRRPGFECPLYVRKNGRYPCFEGYVPVDAALALLVAGEA